MSRLKWTIFTVAVIAYPWGSVHAQLSDNVFRQADKLIVKPEAYNLVVKDKLTFKIFLQNNMDRGIAEISLMGDSPAFDITASPRQMSLPKDRRAFFEVTLAPKPETTAGNYPVNFRLVGGGQLFKSFSVNTGWQGKTSGGVPSVTGGVPESAKTADFFVDKPVSVKAIPGVRQTKLEEGAASSSTMPAQAGTNRGPARASSRSAADDLRRGRVDDQTNRPAARGGEVLAPKADLPAKLKKHVLQVRAVSDIPEIDGVINDPAWKSAAVLANFSVAAGGQAVYDTTGLLLRDSRNLYMGLYCNDENVEVLTDQDGIEVQLTRNAAGRPAYSLFLSPAGKVALTQILPNGQTIFWPASGIRYVAGKDKNSWTAEIVIPFSALNVPASSAPSRWYLRVIRTKASGNAETSFWAPDASGYNSDKGVGTLELVP